MPTYLGNKKMQLMLNGKRYIVEIQNKIHYVSLGDSIAGGHAIDDDWSVYYGEGSQYGKNGNTSTVIVPNSYTDLLRQDMANMYKDKDVSAKSFARSGDRVDDLLVKLSHEAVRKAIAKASLVTICIGANDVLEPAMSHLEEYINTGDLSSIESIVEANLANLNNDSSTTSYKALFDTLAGINPNAKYVFTTIYNPYKYLWLEDGKNGFFAPVLNTIPQMTILGFEVDVLIKNGLLDASAVRTLYNRVNGLNAWAERYVTRLNQVLRNKINAYQSINANFAIADTKAVFDTVPDRPVSAQKHYNDLVNVEYTRGYNTATMDWGRLYVDTSVYDYWWNLATKYVSWSGLDINGLAGELVDQIIEKVIVPDIDPHPETYGQYVLKKSFEDALGWSSLNRYTITFNANGGSGTMSAQTVLGVDGLPAYANVNTSRFTPSEGNHFVEWNTKADGSGTSYNAGQLIKLTSDITLYAQWSNLYTITFMHTNHTNLYSDDETGHKECYALWIAGEEQADFGKFSEGSVRKIQRPYGTRVGVVVSCYTPNEITYDDANTGVYWNGACVASGYGTNDDSPAMYEFTLTCDVTVDFRWKIAGSLATLNAQSWEDCYITTHN